MQPYIAEWGGEDLVHSEDGWELGLWMGSPMVGSLELRFYLHISVLSLLPLYIYLLPIIIALPDDGTFFLHVFELYTFGWILWEIFGREFYVLLTMEGSCFVLDCSYLFLSNFFLCLPLLIDYSLLSLFIQFC